MAEAPNATNTGGGRLAAARIGRLAAARIRRLFASPAGVLIILPARDGLVAHARAVEDDVSFALDALPSSRNW